MPLVATLIATPASRILDSNDVECARSALPSAQAPSWLDPGIAVDVPFAVEGEDLRVLAGRVRAALAGIAIDVVVQGAAVRRKRLLLADMDSTMIGQECI